MTPLPRSLAAMATRPGRESALAAALASLRPQVERLHVVCHDMTAPPDAVREFADVWLCEPDTRGSAAKLHWSRSHTGLYLGCDDDFEYPPDYAATMLRWVKRWKGRALVTCHGRVLKPQAKGFEDVSAAASPQGASWEGWLNYPGACAIAFDTRLNVPDRVPGKNLEEVHLAEWAQRNRVPIWLVPHPEKWFRYLLEGSDLPTIWNAEKGARFANRNAVIAPRGRGAGWAVHRAA